VPLFAVDNVGSITILMYSVKDKNNLFSSMRGMEGKNERSPEFYYFLKGPLVRYNLNFLQPTGYVMNQQFNIQQLCTLPTLY
jgi:hypothetical protein